MTTTLAAVAAHLHVRPERLASMDKLSNAQQLAFSDLVARAFQAEDKAFDAGLEEALTMVPRLLRPAARSILFGGSRG